MTTANTDLDNLAAQAAQDETLNPVTTDETTTEEKKPDSKQEAIAIVTLASETLVGAYPELASVYNTERREAIANAFAYTFEYYGLTVGGFMSHPLFVLGAALLPVIPPTYKAATKPTVKQEAIADMPATPMQPVQPVTDVDSLHNKV
jgi:hypothetical protein